MISATNILHLIGNLGKDPEAGETKAGKTYAKFTLAVARDRDNTDWFNITTWGKTAEFAIQFLKKGKQVSVVGQMRQEKWTDNNGNSRSSYVVWASDFKMLGKKGDDEETATPKKTGRAATIDIEDELDEDIPPF